MNLSEFSLRGVNIDDASLIYGWRNSDRIRNNMLSEELIDYEDHLNWMKKVVEDPSRDINLFLHKGCPIGVITFSDIDIKSCVWGFYLGVTKLPRGTGKLMTFLALDYAFEVMGMEEVKSYILRSNEVSINLHLKLGFIIDKIYLNIKGESTEVIRGIQTCSGWRSKRAEVKSEIDRYSA